MKILLVNKYFYIKGGSETYFFGLKKMLEDHNHEVIDFSMEDEKNFHSDYQEYFVANKEYENVGKVQKIKNALSLIHSNEAYKKLCKLIENTRPDIAHVNLIYHQLTPSIFHALKKYNIPVVFTSHDYKVICPNYKLYSKDEICNKCQGGAFYHCAINKCHKDSSLYSTLLSIESYFHKYKKSYQIADYIICPSNFMLEQLASAGYKREKLVHFPNFLTNDFLNREAVGIKDNRTLLYYGRLSREKGLDLLLDANKLVQADYILKIIGTGPEEERLKKRVEDENIKNVIFLGFKTGDDLQREIREAKATIIPSTWHEVFGLTIIESYSVGTPVIGSNLGGVPENIIDKKTGYIFEANNADNLKDCIEEIVNMDKESEEYKQMEEACLSFKNKFSTEKYYKDLIELYKNLISNKGMDGVS